ncbi:MAG: hypothetical protein ACKPCP_28875, partial [Sphaerospermopsis kisseleviana]
ARYNLTLELKDSQERRTYTATLNTTQENNPDLFFTPEVCQQIRSYFQNPTQRRINDENLKYILNTWIKDIKQGYRDTIISMILPLLSGANLEDLVEPGNYHLPLPSIPDLSAIEPQGGALPSLIFN